MCGGRPSRLLVEVARTEADPVARVRELLADNDVKFNVSPGYTGLSLDLGQFVQVELEPDKIAAAIVRLEGDAGIVSVTPEPDAEP